MDSPNKTYGVELYSLHFVSRFSEYCPMPNYVYEQYEISFEEDIDEVESINEELFASFNFVPFELSCLVTKDFHTWRSRYAAKIVIVLRPNLSSGMRAEQTRVPGLPPSLEVVLGDDTEKEFLSLRKRSIKALNDHLFGQGIQKLQLASRSLLAVSDFLLRTERQVFRYGMFPLCHWFCFGTNL
ncbi:hypothetical protein M9H77_11528 [Catharanthus roseus]|uniref:Uncharacterized protein n=1 Tax=Catharanthus roseus TaxID=4058 RepID=A0ACC0BES8_CATRO|nr:hypothetical protein M9H77_11528 [Catharanthus roseus]